MGVKDPAALNRHIMRVAVHYDGHFEYSSLDECPLPSLVSLRNALPWQHERVWL